jgi:hypothetical protein
MKRILKLLVIGIFIMCFSISTSAAVSIQPFAVNTNTYTSFLTFSGNSAICNVTIYGATGTTQISNCTVTLKESNGTLVKEWTNQSATGDVLNFSKIATSVSSGKTYVLSFSATVHRNGTTENISGSITKKYN